MTRLGPRGRWHAREALKNTTSDCSSNFDGAEWLRIALARTGPPCRGAVRAPHGSADPSGDGVTSSVVGHE